MDENVKNDAKQVMLVQNADDGRLQAVTGVDRGRQYPDRRPHGSERGEPAEREHAGFSPRSLLQKVHGTGPEPRPHGYLRHDGECPEQTYPHRLRPGDSGKLPYRPLRTASDAGAKRQFEPLDVTKIDLADMEKKGIRMEDIEPHLKAMSYGHKSNGLVEMNPELENGMRVSTKGRVSLEEQADGSLRVVPHYWQ